MAFTELKARQSVMWGNGPYERVTNTLTDLHELVIERSDPKPGERVLDAATGTGAVAILVAKRGADVVGMDLAPVLIDTARERAAEEGVSVQWDVGDAEAMDYEDASFDVVVSTCGVMFAPDHSAVAHELARVTKPGGRVVLACWTPEGGLGQMFGMMRPFLAPPPEGAGSPFAWGKEDHVRELLGASFELEFEEHDSILRTADGEEIEPSRRRTTDQKRRET
jgi:SAM-dependent methyltransferase